MKASTVLPLTVLVALAQALVIPNINNQNLFQVSKTLNNQQQQVLNAEVAKIQESPYAALADVDPTILNNALLSKEEAAPIISTQALGRDVIPNRYIVVFKDGVKPEEIKFHQEWASITHLNAAQKLYQSNPTNQFFLDSFKEAASELGGVIDGFHIEGSISGYFGHFLDDTIDLIRRNPHVAFVEQDSRVYANEFDTQNGAPWGLSRISHREGLTLGSFNKYLYDTDAGEGVTSYVIDTGVNVGHQDFDKRAKWGKTVPQGDQDVDGNGHGTHCAGTIGGKTYGVAKKANIVAVKVLRSNGSGTMSDVVKGVEYAAVAHKAAVKEGKKGFKGSTANMSLGGGKSPSLDLAVNAAVDAGIHFAVAAGNDNADACNYSPASAEKAVTVGASTLSDARAYFSNYGKCVDIFGPGLNILSTYIGSDTATATLSGTSMASPHVAGLLTYYLSLQPGSESEFFTAKGGITPAQLKKKIIDYSTKDKLTDIPSDTPNKLIYNGAGGDLEDFWNAEASSSEEAIKTPKVDSAALLKDLEANVEKIVGDMKQFIESNI
ncbi:putative secreted protein [Wickerhamomyces ciferrii]|uniref:Secreted protein n=1 Tax=Wickerhamomyces ciferrii (strain ATCC 14091 / BCRC 22168 / CBS 111 / JCM 3599 / NBRC 0793 / NRRL Y-1031 F-60-10) TaxID=1206466 RepID=K0KLN5_WICCF|nr:uncharacterized protein BN7_5764 [Wickerhamomyces ciferrii]CCH46175.1 putative secreted protein [Wickerhamomyces ciferrii]